MRVITACAVLFLAGSLSLAKAADITGAGATFPAPAYTAWASEYKGKTGVEVNYQAIGSGGGQTQITNRTVDFGASDAPVAADKLQAAKLLQFPTLIGAVVPIVNLEGVPGGTLKLSGPVLAEIYLGKITKWNDAKIAALNSGAALPDQDIAVIYRADGSGTTYVFTSYLATVSAEWKDMVGAATSVQWPSGTGAKGNDGVAGMVKNTPGGIGYVEYVYAAQNGLATAELQNKAGGFVKPGMEAFKAAASGADWAGAKDFAVSMIDSSAKDAWPIVSATFILLPKDVTDAAKTAEVLKFFDWAYKEGAAIAEKLHYIALPQDVVDRVRAAWTAEIKAQDGKAIYAP